jgi:hypothetical protein
MHAFYLQLPLPPVLKDFFPRHQGQSQRLPAARLRPGEALGTQAQFSLLEAS